VIKISRSRIFIALTVLVCLIGLVPTVFADQNSYNFTVHVPSHAFGADAVTIFVKTANGYTDQQDVSTQQNDVTWTFSIPPNQGDTIQVCVHTAGILNIINQNCRYWSVNQETGTYTVSMNSP
jgi:hypothetical protein